MENNTNTSITRINSTDLVRVGKSIDITNKILFGGISHIFNLAFFKLNSKQLKENDKDYLFLLETDPMHRKKSRYQFIAKSKEEYKEALSLFLSIIKIKPKHCITLDMIGLCKTELSDYISAIEYFTEAIEIDPQYAYAYCGRGDVKDIKSDYNGASADYSKAIELDPQFSEAYRSRAWVKESLRDWNGAIEDFSKAIEINPQNAELYYRRGEAMFIGFNDWERAIEDFTKAIEIDPQYVQAYIHRVIAKEKQQIIDWEGIIDDYTRAIELKPEVYDFYFDRGIAKKACGDLVGYERDNQMYENIKKTSHGYSY